MLQSFYRLNLFCNLFLSTTALLSGIARRLKLQIIYILMSILAVMLSMSMTRIYRRKYIGFVLFNVKVGRSLDTFPQLYVYR